MVSGSQDNPPPGQLYREFTCENTVPVGQVKVGPVWFFISPYWIIKCANIPLSLSFPRSFDHSWFLRSYFSLHWYEFLLKILNLGLIMWHSLHIHFACFFFLNFLRFLSRTVRNFLWSVITWKIHMLKHTLSTSWKSWRWRHVSFYFTLDKCPSGTPWYGPYRCVQPQTHRF